MIKRYGDSIFENGTDFVCVPKNKNNKNKDNTFEYSDTDNPMLIKRSTKRKHRKVGIGVKILLAVITLATLLPMFVPILKLISGGN